MGVVPQTDNLDDEVDVVKNLEIYAGYFGLSRESVRPRIGELLDFMSLDGREHDSIQELSGGLKRRLAVVRALLNDPDLVVLDEPTTGLDPQVRHLIWARLRELKSRGVTLLLTTHYMEEAHQLCDRLIVLDHGRILAEGSPRDLVAARLAGHVLELPGAMAPSDLPPGAQCEIHGDLAYIYSSSPDDLERLAVSSGVEYRIRSTTLEDLFLKLTGESSVNLIERPHVPGRLTRVLAVTRRHVYVYTKDFWANSFPTVLEPLIFILAVGWGLAAAVGSMGGTDYLSFLAPAQAMMAAVYTAAFEESYGAYFRLRVDCNYNSMLATPVSVDDVFAGELLFTGLKASSTRRSCSACWPCSERSIRPGRFSSAPGILHRASGRQSRSLCHSHGHEHQPIQFFHLRHHLAADSLLGHSLPIESLPAALAHVARWLPLYPMVEYRACSITAPSHGTCRFC